MTKYLPDYDEGYAAARTAAEAHTNPHQWKSVRWWAWHAGWEAGRAKMAAEFDSLLTELSTPATRIERRF